MMSALIRMIVVVTFLELTGSIAWFVAKGVKSLDQLVQFAANVDRRALKAESAAAAAKEAAAQAENMALANLRVKAPLRGVRVEDK